jgi:hypothetical protein
MPWNLFWSMLRNGGSCVGLLYCEYSIRRRVWEAEKCHCTMYSMYTVIHAVYAPAERADTLKAVERGDKRTRRFQVRVLALRENPDEFEYESTLQEKARRGRVLDIVLRDTPSPRTSTRSLDTGSMDRTLNTKH